MKRTLKIFASLLAIGSMPWLAVNSFADIVTTTKNYQDTNGFFVVQFKYDNSWCTRPATNPPGVPHYEAMITVLRVIDGTTKRVCEPWKGVFTDGKCYEDNLTNIVAKALKSANASMSLSEKQQKG